MIENGNEAWFGDYFGPDYLKIDFQPNTDNEVAFMTEALELGKGSKLLDAACGYGRHMIPLLRQGIDVTGCDLSSFMIEEAKRRLDEGNSDEREVSASFVNCDLRELPYTEEFDAACLMFNSFGYFKSEDDNFRVLAAVSDSLKDDGLFLLDLVNRDYLIRHPAGKDWIERDDAVILEEKHFDAVRNRSEIDVHVIDGDGKRSYHHSIRLYPLTEIAMLLEAAGLAVESVYGGFGGELYDWNSERMLIVSRRFSLDEE